MGFFGERRSRRGGKGGRGRRERGGSCSKSSRRRRPPTEKEALRRQTPDHVARLCSLASFLRGGRVEVRHRKHKCPRPRRRHLQRRELRAVRFAWLGLLVLAYHLVLVSSQRR